MSTYLQHHGILGQKWGKRNGPPYPLNAEGKRAIKEQKRREKILKDPNKLRKHRDEFTREEIRDAIVDLKLNQELKDIPAKDINRGASAVKISAEAVGKTVASILALAGIYNIVAVFANKQFDTNLPALDLTAKGPGSNAGQAIKVAKEAAKEVIKAPNKPITVSDIDNILELASNWDSTTLSMLEDFRL